MVERPVPRPAAGELLVKVAAAGVSRPDLLQVKGMYPPPPGAPHLLGLEIAGEVVERVRAPRNWSAPRALVAGGGHAEYCAAPVGTCLFVPDAISLTEAAAMPETLFTVWINLFERGFAADGDWVLVHGGTSGIGTMAIALGKLFGLKVIVTCGSDAKSRARWSWGGSGDQLSGAGFRRGSAPGNRPAAGQLVIDMSAATICRGTSPAWRRKAGTSPLRCSGVRRRKSPSSTSCAGG